MDAILSTHIDFTSDKAVVTVAVKSKENHFAAFQKSFGNSLKLLELTQIIKLCVKMGVAVEKDLAGNLFSTLEQKFDEAPDRIAISLSL